MSTGAPKPTETKPLVPPSAPAKPIDPRTSGGAAPTPAKPSTPSPPSSTPVTTAAAPTAPAGDVAHPADSRPQRLLSLDAYRGFIMLAMASSALGFVQVARKADVMEKFAETKWDTTWRWMWESLAYQFDHVAWTGCAFWDLIQPSFMFMVGVAVPFSNARRIHDGHSHALRFVHVLWRSLILVLLGVFLSSNGAKLTNFTFVNVLTQIGLGYPILYLVSEKTGRRENVRGWLAFQLGVVGLILAGYSAWFVNYSLPEAEWEPLHEALVAAKKPDTEWTQFSGIAKPWNKHVNAAAAVDRKLLNLFPRTGDTPEAQRFWFNDGGYQTLNFIPSLATMILGLMAGTVLRSDRGEWAKWRWLMVAGLLCFLVVLPIDSTIWPGSLSKWVNDWSLCPSVKRIWSPTWAVFSSGWTFWILATFYMVIDLWKWRAWSWPLAVVGMNSIAMYCMSQLLRPFTRSALDTHLTTIDRWLGWEQGITFFLFSKESAYAPIYERLAILFVFWLLCLWLFSRKIFIRI